MEEITEIIEISPEQEGLPEIAKQMREKFRDSLPAHKSFCNQLYAKYWELVKLTKQAPAGAVVTFSLSEIPEFNYSVLYPIIKTEHY